MDTVIDTAAPEAAVTETAAPEIAQTPTPVTIVETPKVTLDDTLKAVWEKNHPPRSNGKFTARAPKAAAPETTPAETPETTNPADQPEVTATEPATAPAIDVPVSWSAEMKAKWAALPPDAQTYIAQRDKEAQQAISRLGNERKGLEDRIASYKPLDQLVETYKDDFIRRGVSPAQAFQTLLNAQRQLDENPLMGLVQIGQTYGIDLRQFLPQQVQGQVAPPSPEVTRLQAEVDRMKGYLTEQQRIQHEAEQAKVQETETALRSEIDNFRKDKPHFEALQPHMAGLLTSGAADTLAKAYELASWAVPEIRERILTDQRKADDDKRRAEQTKRATEAQKAAQVNVKSATASGQNPKSMDETLREIAGKRYGT